jgi:hypothetical protein
MIPYEKEAKANLKWKSANLKMEQFKDCTTEI